MNNRNQKISILIVDDEPSLRFVLSRSFSKLGYKVDEAESLATAKEKLTSNRYDAAFFDIGMPDGSGLDLLTESLETKEAPSIVVMTAEATMKNAIEAMKRGAFDYITKPFDINETEKLVKRIIEYRSESAKAKTDKSDAAIYNQDEIVGRSSAMQELFKLIGRAANSDATVLITGPTGSGKELVARALAKNSPRSSGPFITVNCAAIPSELLESELFGHMKGAFTGAVENRKGKFMLADGGVLLLDEVGEMPLPLQAKMLRVLQEKEVWPVGAAKSVKVDVRTVASTNRDLLAEVKNKEFREDLFHRLDVIRIAVPPLSERRDDIPDLANHFIDKIAETFHEQKKIFSDDAMEILENRDWSGNVRELENSIRRAVLMAPGATILAEHFLNKEDALLEKGSTEKFEAKIRDMMLSAKEGVVYEEVVGQVERVLIKEALKKSGGVQAKAARLLGINRNTLMKKVNEYRLKDKEQNDVK